MYMITDDVGFKSGKVNFYAHHGGDGMRPVTDYSSRIGVLHGTIPKSEPEEQLVAL